ncbi:MAG: DUF465 domain-containing protein [Pseudomonadota bacterium]
MALDAHLRTLNERHDELEAALAAEIKHPAFDETRVTEIKREKLRIKDQLEEIRVQMDED